MIYVYDILVNLSFSLIDFYDWESDDEVLHIRRMPLFKVQESVFLDIYFNKVKVSDEFLSIIKDKTQFFKGRNVETINYACAFTDGTRAIMIEFVDGVSYMKSKFLVNEEFEIVDLSNSIKCSNISYKVIKGKEKVNSMIRSERKIVDKILENLDLIKDDKVKLDYLCYEWFDKDTGNFKYQELVNSLKSDFTDKHLEFLELVNLLVFKK